MKEQTSFVDEDLITKRRQLQERLYELEEQTKALLAELETIENQMQEAGQQVVDEDFCVKKPRTHRQTSHGLPRGVPQDIGQAIARSIGRAVASLDVRNDDVLAAKDKRIEQQKPVKVRVKPSALSRMPSSTGRVARGVTARDTPSMAALKRVLSQMIFKLVSPFRGFYTAFCACVFVLAPGL